MASTILIVDDDETQRQLLASLAERLGYVAECVASGEEAFARVNAVDAPRFDAALIDLIMPDLDGMAVIDRLRRMGQNLPILALATPQGLDSVMSAIRAGANDFIIKPVAPERLAVSLANAMKLQALTDDPSRMLDLGEAEPDHASAGLVVDAALTAYCEKHAKSDMPLLIEGETGTGKSVLARLIHRASVRRKRPCITISAEEARSGGREWLANAYRKAKGGSLIIKSVEALSPDDQLTLLTHFQPVDGPMTVRLIATSSADFLMLIRTGRFREDLFYLITTGTLRVPPLRNRREELHRLARQILLKEAHSQSKNLHGLAPNADHLIEMREWPGNIPELQSLIRRAIRYADSGLLTAEHLEKAEADRDMRALLEPVMIGKAGKGPDNTPRMTSVALFDSLGRLRPFADIEAEILREVHEHCRGRVAAMARQLGIGRSTIYRKLKELGLDSPAEADSMIGEAA